MLRPHVKAGPRVVRNSGVEQRNADSEPSQGVCQNTTKTEKVFAISEMLVAF
jgi:hypothetical protein